MDVYDHLLYLVLITKQVISLGLCKENLYVDKLAGAEQVEGLERLNKANCALYILTTYYM